MARRFTLEPTIIPRNQYLAVVQAVKTSRDFGPVTRARVSGWNKLAKKLTNEYNSVISAQQILSIRAATIKQYIVQNTHRMNARARILTTEYNSGKDILTLSHEHNYPPLSILRIIFDLKYSGNDVRAVFTRGGDPHDMFTGRDLAQYKRAAAADILESTMQRGIHQVAARNERIFVDKFKATGVKLRTQDDLAAEQIKLDGRASLTPDLLFDEPVIINGQPTAWIDYKDYVGTPVGFLMESNRKQAAKYTQKWGPGAICYNGGVVEGVEITGAQLLDASVIFSAESLT